MPGTSFARLLPPLNSFSLEPEPSLPPEILRKKVNEVLKIIQLGDEEVQEEKCAEPISMTPQSNTWSRAARRAAARQATDGSGSTTTDVAPLFRAQYCFVNVPRNHAKGAKEVEQEGLGESGPEASDVEAQRGRLELHWIEGRDRFAVEALWKFVLTKAELVGHKLDQRHREPSR